MRLLAILLCLTLTRLTASYGQILIIDGDSLHCFTTDEAKSIVRIIYERDHCNALLNVTEEVEIQYRGILDNLERQKEVQKQVIANYRIITEGANSQIAHLHKSLEGLQRRNKFTKMAALLVGAAFVGIYISK